MKHTPEFYRRIGDQYLEIATEVIDQANKMIIDPVTRNNTNQIDGSLRLAEVNANIAQVCLNFSKED